MRTYLLDKHTQTHTHTNTIEKNGHLGVAIGALHDIKMDNDAQVNHAQNQLIRSAVRHAQRIVAIERRRGNTIVQF